MKIVTPSCLCIPIYRPSVFFDKKNCQSLVRLLSGKKRCGVSRKKMDKTLTLKPDLWIAIATA